MGVCSSCLGGRNHRSENPETSRLLYDDPYRAQYGSTGGQRSQYQPDPESLRREREALESLCHAMSDDVVDVFTIFPSKNVEKNQEKSQKNSEPTSSSSSSSSHTTVPKKQPITPKTSAIIEQTNTDSHEPAPQEMAYRSVKRIPKGHIATDLNRDEEQLRDAKAVM